jgi:hypothetical protein
MLGLVAGTGEGLHLIPGCGHGVEVGSVVLWVGGCSFENSRPTNDNDEPGVRVPGKPAPPIQTEEACAICSKLGKHFTLSSPIGIGFIARLQSEVPVVVLRDVPVETAGMIQARAPPLA